MTGPISRPRLPLTWWGIVLRFLAGFALLMSANFICVPLVAPLLEDMPEEDPARLLIMGASFPLTLLVVGLGVHWWMRLVERRSLTSTGLVRWRDALPGLVGGTALVSVPVAVGWIVLAQISEPMEIVADGGAGGEVGVGLVLGIVCYQLVRAYVLQGIPEELIFRGWFFSLTPHRPWFTFLWTTLGFSVIHLISSGGQQTWTEHLHYLVMPLGMGALAGAVVLWRGSTWWAAGTHGGFHLSLGVASVVHPLELDVATWWVMGVVQLLAAGLVLWRWSARRGISESAPVAVE